MALKDTVFCDIKVGSTRIKLCGTKNHLYTTLSGARLFENSTVNAFTTDVLPVVSLIVGNLAKKHKVSPQISCDKSDSSNAEILNKFTKGLEDSGVTLVEVSDEIEENASKDRSKAAAQAQVPGMLLAYGDVVQSSFRNALECVELAQALLSTNFPKTMWGVQGVEKELATVTGGLNDLEGSLGQYEIWAERSEKRLSHLVRGVAASVSCQDMRPVVVGLVEDSMKIKEILSRMCQVFYRLCDIDKVFKKFTGYPTTWFFNSSTFYDFVYSFENLINDLIRMAAAETSTINPLFAWVNKDTGAKTCPTI